MQRNYRHTKDVLKYSAVYKKRRKAKTVKMVILGILCLCFLIGIVFVLRMSTFTISEIQVKGLQSANTQDVINEVDSQVGGNYALILPKKNIFFYPKDKIKTDLLNKFSTFANVDINTIDTNKLEIAITEKNAEAVSCKTDVSITADTFSDCFFIDSGAKAFQTVSGEPDQSLTRYVDYNVNSTSSVLTVDVIKQLKKISENLVSKNLVVQYVKIIDSRNVEFQIKDNGKIMVSLPVVDDFLSILDTALNTKMLSSGVRFDYVDARFGNKVFFKLGSGVNGESGTSSTSTISTLASPTGTVAGTSTINIISNKVFKTSLSTTSASASSTRRVRVIKNSTVKSTTTRAVSKKKL